MAEVHEDFMRRAIAAAREAESLGDIPIGCVVVLDGVVIGRGFNRRELDQDPLAHAEMLALREAAHAAGSWRLEGARLYVTLEPCPMCAGAIILSRVAEVYYGAPDPKGGCCGTLMNLLADTRFNHQPKVVAGVLGEECGEMLTTFFRGVRDRKKQAKAERSV
jgi:tRNA(adenine34) deaminase